MTGTEVEDEDSAYEVEVTRGDGTQVDVQLDKDFQVLSTEDEAVARHAGCGANLDTGYHGPDNLSSRDGHGHARMAPGTIGWRIAVRSVRWCRRTRRRSPAPPACERESSDALLRAAR